MNRSEDYMSRITLDALDREVILDAKIKIVPLGSKLKAWCENTQTYLQFPREIRAYGRTFVADVVKTANKTCKVFYRAYPNSIRESIDGPIIA